MVEIVRDIEINLTPEFVIEEQYRGRRRRASEKQKAGLLKNAQEAIEAAKSLYEPAVIYDEFEVSEISGEKVAVSIDSEQPVYLTIGPKIDLLEPAKRVIVAVHTIGRKLEDKVEELMQSGDALHGYMLDSVGVLALGAAGEALHHIAEARAEELGWGLGPALAPGTLVGWDLSGQRQLCDLLPLERIGVELNPYYVLEPHKSVSTLVGLGPKYSTFKVGSVCRFCALKESCWRRRKDPNLGQEEDEV